MTDGSVSEKMMNIRQRYHLSGTLLNFGLLVQEFLKMVIEKERPGSRTKDIR
jgi:hypothetical protein